MRHVCRGFTLLELILVLLVLGIISAVVAARLGPMRTTQGVDQAVQQLMDQVLRSQHLAATRSLVVRLRCGLETLVTSVQVIDGAMITDPPDGQPPELRLYDGAETITAAFTRADGTTTATGNIDLLFYPDRRCDPAGTFAIACRDQRTLVHCSLIGTPPVREQEVMP